MNADIKAKWVAALRSGKYAQGQFKLRDLSNRFCCLGVLCDINNSKRWKKEEHIYNFDGVGLMPDRAVCEWAGFSSAIDGSREIPCVTIDGYLDTLTNHNDAGKTFAQIADAIEEQL